MKFFSIFCLQIILLFANNNGVFVSSVYRLPRGSPLSKVCGELLDLTKPAIFFVSFVYRKNIVSKQQYCLLFAGILGALENTMLIIADNSCPEAVFKENFSGFT